MKKLILFLVLGVLLHPFSASAQDEEKVASLIKTARIVSDRTYMSVPELERWMRAAQKQGDLTVIDTDGDGQVTPGTDLTNSLLGQAGVIDTFIQARMNMGDDSPWYEGMPLWMNGGQAASQAECDATPYYGGIKLCYSPSQYGPDIRSIFVTAADVDPALNILYSKTVTGVSDAEKRAELIELAKKGAAELEKWIRAAQREGGLTEVDTDGDGAVTPGTDLTNTGLGQAGVIATFIQARMNAGDDSPWYDGMPLWINGGQASSQAECDAAPFYGGIKLCYSPSQYGPDIRTIFVSAADIDPNIIYSKAVTGVSDAERRIELTELAKKGVSELERWIRAAQREGDLTEIDTDGDGAVIPGTDLTNTQLGQLGVIATFIQARMNKGDGSPWYDGMPLWINGGQAASQAECDAAPFYGGIKLCYSPSQYGPDIRSIFVSAADIDPNIIYSKSVTGVSDAERRVELIELAKEGVTELEKWIMAVHKEGSLTEIDTDGDGMVTTGTDLTNTQLGQAGVIATFIQSRMNMGDGSPWYDGMPLWINGGQAASQAECDALPFYGGIKLCYSPSQYGPDIRTIFVSAADIYPNIIYSKSVTGVSDAERRVELIELANNSVPELEKWIKALQKAWTPDGSLVEVDTDGDGVVNPLVDMDNDAIAAAGVVSTFIQARRNMGDGSPWYKAMPLWLNGGQAASQAECDAVPYYGGIKLCYSPTQHGPEITTIFMSAADTDTTPNIIYSRTISGN